MSLEVAAKSLAEQMVLAARLGHHPSTPPTKTKSWFSGRTRLAAACGLALLLLLLLWRTATDEPFIGSWAQDVGIGGRTDSLLGPARGGVALSFSRDGSFEGRVEGEDLSGQWKLVRRDGQTNTLELTRPGEQPRLVQATPLDDGRLRVSFAGGPGTYNLTPSGSGSGSGSRSGCS
jgi:hypothetical protein